MSVTAGSPTPNRRERLRAATLDEIHTVARHLLTTDGLTAVTLRAIGREMGMTAPALYRYYASLGELRTNLCVLFYDECTGYIEASVAGLTDAAAVDRILTACRAFRTWSITHRPEFTMMFGTGSGSPNERSTVEQAGMRFAGVFIRLFVEMWHQGGMRVPADADLPPNLREQFAGFLAQSQIPLPVGAMQVFTSAWIRVYGMVTLDVFGNLDFCLTDSDPMFEIELAAIARDLGFTPRDPGLSGPRDSGPQDSGPRQAT